MTNPKNNNEVNILNNAIKIIEKKKGKRLVQSEENKKIIDILEDFIIKKKLICYGGTAINNILPAKDQFYNKTIEFPDYDFFSTNALDDAKELADIYYKKKYQEVEAKAGIHPGTFKVFVNFKAIADVTQIDNSIFKLLKKDAIVKNKIHYAPPNFLRMSMYLELSRPDGDVSRWEKVLKRLILLNKNYPLRGAECNTINFENEFLNNNSEIINNIIKNVAVKEKLVFFGAYSLSLYSKYYKQIKIINKSPMFDLLSNNPLNSINIIKNLLEKHFNNVSIIYHESIGENIPLHYQLKINNNSILFIYKTHACYSYNNIKINNKIYRIATIDTLLSFYLAFYYTNRKYYDKNRILCISEFLFKVHLKNKLNNKNIIKRFTSTCYGNQKTIEQIRREKNYKYHLLKSQKNNKEFEYNFLKYNPNYTNLNYNNNKKISSTTKKKKISLGNKNKKLSSTIKKSLPSF